VSESPREFITEGGTCAGDSGSGAYEQASVDKGAPYVMGVLSRALEAGATCVDSAYTRTDAFAPLIVAAARKAALAGGYPLPAWANDPVALADAGTDAAPAPGPGPTPTGGSEADAAPHGRGDAVGERGNAAEASASNDAGCHTAGGGLGNGRAQQAGIALLAGVILLARRRRSRG
jgi:hypothetical protein